MDSLAAALSRDLLRAPMGTADQQITLALQRVAEVHDLQDVALLDVDPAIGRVDLRSRWGSHPVDPGSLVGSRSVMEHLAAGEVVAWRPGDPWVSGEAGSSAGAGCERAWVALPLDVAGSIQAALYVVARDDRRWAAATLEDLGQLLTIVGGFAVRARSLQQLQRYRAFLDASSSGTLVFNAEGRLIEASVGACAMLGRPHEELLRLEPREFIDPECLDAFAEFMRAMDEGEPFFGRCRAVHANGSFIEVEAEGRLITVEGRSDRFVNLVDLSSRHAAEMRARRHAEYQALVAELSTHLLAADSARMGPPIENAMRRIGARYDVDAVGLWWFEDPGTWFEPYRWVAESISRKMSLSETVWLQRFDVEEVPYFSERLRQGECIRFEALDDLPPEAERERGLCAADDITSQLLVPMRVDGVIVGVLETGVVDRDHAWPDELVEELRTLGEILAVAHARSLARQAIDEREARLRAMQEQLERENLFLRDEVREATGKAQLVGQSKAFRRCLHLIERVAPTDATVLIHGETGTGKELLARALHDLSGRDGPLVSVNCAALPANLIESELFGHERGAFTGADARKLGRLEVADRGTLFLDEIGELPLGLQSKLLRVLQERTYERVGSVESRAFGGRVVAATNRDLAERVERGEFRRDLFYRLNVFPVEVPALRERIDDIPHLARHLALKHAGSLGRPLERITSRTLDALARHNWPGNVRELESVIQRAIIVGDGPVLDSPQPLGERPAVSEAQDAAGGAEQLVDIQRAHILLVLQATGWVVEGPEGAARRLGLNASTLRSRMKRLGIQRESSRPIDLMVGDEGPAAGD